MTKPISLIPSHQTRPAEDPIFGLNHEATERRARGEAVVNATVGALLDDDGKLAVLPSSIRAVREVPPEEWATYAPIAGTPGFNKAVVASLFAKRPELVAKAVAVATPGGSGALRHAIANYLEPGQALLTSNYFWGPYATLADEGERAVTTFPMFDRDGSGRLDLAAFERGLDRVMTTQKRVLLMMNDPCHNPTGYSMHEGEWRQVAEILERHAARGPLTMLVDTAYIAYGARDFSSTVLDAVAPLIGKIGLLFAWSASKTFTHYGLRVGALVAMVDDPRERAMTEAALSYSCRGTWSNCNRGGLTAIGRMLTDAPMVTALDAERAQLQQLLDQRVAVFNHEAKRAGLRYPRYEGGFFVTVFHEDAPGQARKMKEHGVFVVPQRAPEGETTGALRVALCAVAEKDVPRVVESLAS
jgi:aromatic-amino-acid transaminase